MPGQAACCGYTLRQLPGLVPWGGRTSVLITVLCVRYKRLVRLKCLGNPSLELYFLQGSPGDEEFCKHVQIIGTALAGVTQRIELQPVNGKVAGSIPCQGTRLGFWARSPVGETNQCFSSSLSPSFLFSLKISKLNL